MQSIRIILNALVFLVLASTFPELCLAQTQNAMQQEQGQNAIMAAVQALQDQVRADLQKAAVSLEKLSKKVDEAADADNQLAELKLQVDAVAKAVSEAMGALENRYNLVSKRLDEIGAPPAAGQPAEDASISGDRKRLQGEKAQMNGVLSDADALGKQAVELADHITDLRRKLFTETLFRHTDINEQFFNDTVAAGQSESFQLWARAALISCGSSSARACSPRSA
mgnify:FL=1